MTMTLSGDGSITGLAAGGLPNGTVTADDLAAGAINTQALALFNASGSAPVYACRAWVNFDGTGTPAIRASGNVSSITDNNTGDYTVNFTTAFADVDYCSLATGTGQVGITIDGYANIRDPQSEKKVGSVRVQQIIGTATAYDTNNMNVAIFR